eukprot:Skav220271  [mRNA]  locus=scaffold3532:69031:70317:- [translate_table: standard]
MSWCSVYGLLLLLHEVRTVPDILPPAFPVVQPVEVDVDNLLHGPLPPIHAEWGRDLNDTTCMGWAPVKGPFRGWY